MKNIIVYLLCSILLMATFSFGASAATNTFNITDLEGKYKTQGRTELVDGALFMEWTASGIEFKANCSGDVSIKVNATRLQQNDRGGIFFTVIVDGVVQYENQRIPENVDSSVWVSNSTNYPFKISRSGVSEFTIANNLPSGTHTFEIYTQTEAFNGAFGIQSITLNGEILAAEGNNDLYIEFVGDSVTASMGNLATGSIGEDALYQDATRGWAYLTAKQLNADWSIIARTGITASNGMGWSGVNSVSMQTVYPKLRYFSKKNLDYDFSRPVDVIVLALGTNDASTYARCGKTLDYVKSQFIETVKLLQNKNPNAKIVWVYGMMTNDVDSTITDVISELGGANEGLYALKLPRNNAGPMGHPNLATQPTYANMVADFIKDITKPVNNQNPTQSGPSGTTPSSPSNSGGSTRPQSRPNNTTTSSPSNSIGNTTPQSNPNSTTASSPNANANTTPQNNANASNSSNSTNPVGQQQGNGSASNVIGNNNVSSPDTPADTQNTQSETTEIIVDDENTGSKMRISTIIIIVVMVICVVAIGVLIFFSSKLKNT